MAAEPATEKPSPAAEPVAATPAPEPKPAKPRQPSKAGFLRRLGIGVNVTIQIVLAAFILLAVNGYAFKHFHRFDFTRDHKYALSDRTKQFLRSLDKPVKMTVLMGRNSPIAGDVTNLAEEYRNAQPKFINLDAVDPYRDFTRAAELQTKYKLAQQENVVVLDCEGRTQVISQDKMAEVDAGNEMLGQPPQVVAFTGEQAITAGLIEVSEGKKSTVYYIQGHGEPSMAKGKALGPIGDQLAAEHLTVSELNLLNTESIPGDATVLLLIGARYDLTDREITMLNAYWDKGGRLFVLLDPEAATPKLAGFLGRLGVRPDDDRILGQINVMGVKKLIKSAVGLFAGDTTVATRLADVTPVFYGSTQSLTLTPEAGATTGLKVSPLLIAAKGFWGETDYKDMETAGADNDPAKDKQYPLNVAATVEKGAVGDQRVQVTASRLVTVGNSSFVDPAVMDQPLYDFFVSAINWLGEREALVGIPPKPVKNLNLNIPEDAVSKLFYVLILAIPGVGALLGFLVWWWRRRS